MNNTTVNNTTVNQQTSLGSLGNTRLGDLPFWPKAIEKVTDYYAQLEKLTIDEAFSIKGNRNGLPFSTQVLGNIRLVNSGSIAQSFQSWRTKHPDGDISQWIANNLYQLTANELKAMKEKEDHEKEVAKTASDLLAGISVIGIPSPQQIKQAKDMIIARVGEEVYNKVLELLDIEQ